MFKTYFLTGLRNLKAHKGYAFINVFGLAVGIACCLLIFLYVQQELRYDRYHDKADRIYRVAELYTQSGNQQWIANSSGPWGPTMLDEFPEVANYVRFKPPSTEFLISYEDRHFYEKGFVFADSTVFDVFSFGLIRGNPKTALAEPNAVVLTWQAAAKYFGAEDPVGKTLFLDLDIPFKVTGVMEDVPEASHFTFDFLASFSTLWTEPTRQRYAGNIDFFLDRRGNIYTYILLAEGASPDALAAKFPAFMDKYGSEILRRIGSFNTLDPFLQPLTEIHLTSQLEREWEPNGNRRYVLIFAAIAVLILLIACINFMNLATARSAGRAKEVGLRKVLGAAKTQLIRQFLGESLFLAALAMGLALGLAHLLLPTFNALSGHSLELRYWGDGSLVPGLVLLTLAVGFVSGSYPAFFLSEFRPAEVLKGSFRADARSKNVRKILTVFQFTISILLLISLGVVQDQMTFIRTTELGYDAENIVLLPLPVSFLRDQYEVYKETLLAHADVLAVSGSETVMGKPVITREMRRLDAAPEDNHSYRLISAEHDFLQTYGMELLDGRFFSEAFGADTITSVIVNEEAAQNLALAEPVDTPIEQIKPVRPKTIVGLVKNFHLEALHAPIQSVMIVPSEPGTYRYISVRISGERIPETLQYLERTWTELYPGVPFIHSFLKEDLDALYRAEAQMGTLFLYFTLLAFFIACLGLFGLAAFTAEQRTREIGIRKALGASSTSIVALIATAFANLVGVAFLLAAPVAYVVMNRWLQDFAYRIEISWWIFLGAGLAALVIALLTVSYQSITAARTDPVRALRHE